MLRWTLTEPFDLKVGALALAAARVNVFLGFLAAALRPALTLALAFVAVVALARSLARPAVFVEVTLLLERNDFAAGLPTAVLERPAKDRLSALLRATAFVARLVAGRVAGPLAAFFTAFLGAAAVPPARFRAGALVRVAETFLPVAGFFLLATEGF